MTSIEGAVIYCRVSSDQSGRARSVSEQEADCRRTCEAEGWPILDVVVDNDLGASQYSRGTRPGFLQLQSLLKRGVVLVSWESSRITRQLSEFAELRDFCADLGVQWYVGGRLYDLHEPQDVYMLGIAAQNAELEVALSRKRVMRALDQNAAKGIHSSRMPFGYQRVGKQEWVIHAEHAAIVREAVRRLLAGETLRAIALDFGRRNLPAPGRGVDKPGRSWTDKEGTGLRSLILTPTYAGIHVRRQRDKKTGKMVEVARTKGDWEPIISEADHYRLVAMLTDPSRTRVWGRQPKHLLSLIAVCGVCDRGMKYHAPPSDPTPRYRCVFGHTMRLQEPMDRLVETAVIDFFSHQVRAVAALYGDDKEAKQAAETARALRQQLDSEILALTQANLSASTRARMAELLEAQLVPQIEAAEAQSRRATNPVLHKFTTGKDSRAVWESLDDIKDRREVVRECLSITVLRMPQGSALRNFDPDSVLIVPKADWWSHIDSE